MCGHESTNLLQTNKEIEKWSDAQKKVYQNKLDTWSKYQKDVADGKNTRKPAGMSKNQYIRACLFKEKTIKP